MINSSISKTGIPDISCLGNTNYSFNYRNLLLICPPEIVENAPTADRLTKAIEFLNAKEQELKESRSFLSKDEKKFRQLLQFLVDEYDPVAADYELLQED